MSRNFKACVTALAVFATLACETPQDNDIEQARQCSDNDAQLAQTQPAVAANIASTVCEPMLQNIETDEAGLIGVGLVLLAEQKLSSLTSVENAISSGSGAVSTSLSFLVFTNPADVTSITSYAQLSQDPGSEELASVVSVAYYANIAASGGLNSSSTPTEVAGFVTSLSTDPVNGPPAAQALLSAQQAACSGGGNSSLCQDLTNAIGSNTSSYTAILQSAATYITNGG